MLAFHPLGGKLLENPRGTSFPKCEGMYTNNPSSVGGSLQMGGKFTIGVFALWKTDSENTRLQKPVAAALEVEQRLKIPV